MTMALCLECGEIKFGAYCRCDKCGDQPSGKSTVEIAFTDHLFSVDTLEEFGEVIKKMKVVCEDSIERYWMFVYYVLKNHPGILKGELEQDLQVYYAKILSDLDLPTVTVRR